MLRAAIGPSLMQVGGDRAAATSVSTHRADLRSGCRASWVWQTDFVGGNLAVDRVALRQVASTLRQFGLMP